MKLIVLCALPVLAAAPGMQALGRIPLYFEPNQGQTADEVRFLARGGGMTMFLTGRETVLASRGSAVHMRMEGSRATAALEGIEKQPGVSNYYHGNDPAKWRTGVPHYAKVKARGVYEGIDVVYYGNPSRIEYDFIVAPGADPGVIRLAYEGAEKIRIDDRGDLVLTTRTGELRQHKPRVYQEVAGRRVELEASYRLHGREATFELASYDHSQSVVIDPVLSYGSYLGGADSDGGAGIGLDSTGAIFVGGTTYSANFPLQSAADSLLESSEAFVTKLTADGKSLVFSTFLGGADGEFTSALVVQPSGNSFLAGTTYSTNFPVVNAYRSAMNGSSRPDAFVVRLDPGGGLVYGTYLGGGGEDRANALAVGSDGSAYVAGVTDSTDFPGAPSANSNREGFVSRIAPSGTALLFTVRIGGSGGSAASGVAVDASGIYVTGFTGSRDMPVLPVSGPIQGALSGISDAFAAKIKPDGSGLIYSTYLGGSAADGGAAIAVDAAGNAYVTGSTQSDNFPVVNAIYRNRVTNGIYPDHTEVFVTKIGPAGTSIAFSTYLGGDFNDTVSVIAVDAIGRATVGGVTESQNFPTFAALQASANPILAPGFGTGFVARFNATGGLEYSTFVGGTTVAPVKGICLDSAGGTWFTGSEIINTPGGQFPVLNGYSMLPYGGADAFLVKLIDGPPPVTVTVGSIPSGRLVIVDGRRVYTPVTFGWQPGTFHTLDANSPQVENSISYGFTSWSQGGEASQSLIAGNAPVTYTATYTATACSYSANVSSGAFPYQGGITGVTVSAQSWCQWAPVSSAAWAKVSTSSALTGAGGFTVIADPNPGPPRSAAISFATVTIVLMQSGGSANLLAPAIATPTPGQSIQTRGVNFSWNPVAGATAYEIRVLSSSFLTPVFQGWQTGASATSTTIDLPNGGYRFFVRGCLETPSDANCGALATVDLTVRLTAPNRAPQILSPSSGQVFTSSTQEFRWEPVPGVPRYQVILTDALGRAEMQISTPETSTIYSVKGSSPYQLQVRGCQAACGLPGFVNFSTNLAAVPTSAPAVTSATALSPNSYRIDWNAIAGADIYRIAVVQPNTGPGGGALTVASTQSAVPEITLTVPPGPASVIVAACTGRGCGPYSAPFAINPPGPAPGTPVIGQPISVTNVDGPLVLFTWSRAPGDNGSNTTYRLYSADLSRNATALDVLTTNNFYAGLFAAEGRRYDAVVAVNPGPSQSVSAPVGFVVQGSSPESPTPTAPTHEGTVRQGNVEIGWTPAQNATIYQFTVFKTGESAPIATGVTTGLRMQVPLTAQGGGTRYSAILRSCPPANASVCKPGSDAGWGPWSNAPGGPGVTNFTVVP